MTDVVTSQPTFNSTSNTLPDDPPRYEDVISTQPQRTENIQCIDGNEQTDTINKENYEIEIDNLSPEQENEKERRRQRQADDCCCVYISDDDDCFLCHILSNCCISIGNCTESCFESCGNCISECCESNNDSGQDDSCCVGCCDGDSGGCDDCSCDCNCFD